MFNLFITMHVVQVDVMSSIFTMGGVYRLLRAKYPTFGVFVRRPSKNGKGKGYEKGADGG